MLSGSSNRRLCRRSRRPERQPCSRGSPHKGFGGQKKASNGGRVLKRCTGYLGRINDASFDKVLEHASERVVSVVLLLGCEDFGNNDRTFFACFGDAIDPLSTLVTRSINASSRNTRAVQNRLVTSIEVTRNPWMECSRVKSSIKLTLPIHVARSLLSVSTLERCRTVLYGCRGVSGRADKQSCLSYVLWMLIAAPVVPLFACTVIVWGDA